MHLCVNGKILVYRKDSWMSMEKIPNHFIFCYLPFQENGVIFYCIWRYKRGPISLFYICWRKVWTYSLWPIDLKCLYGLSTWLSLLTLCDRYRLLNFGGVFVLTFIKDETQLNFYYPFLGKNLFDVIEAFLTFWII